MCHLGNNYFIRKFCLINVSKGLFLLWLIFSQFNSYSQDRIPVILDADTGNEVDDLYAISRALIEPSWDILALNATHWQTSHWAIPESMENSHRLNQVILGLLDLKTKTRRGGTARMYDWGDKAQHSAAAYEIIKQAKNMNKEQKLTVIALGALTNIASAIYIDPGIESKIKLFWLGTGYEFEQDVLTTIDFNSIMDIQAVNILFNSDVEMHIIPNNTARNMELSFEETEDNLRGIHPLGDYLCDRWYQHLDGSRKKRVIWDLALIEAIIHPDWAEQVIIHTSKDYGNRDISYYKVIDHQKMKEEFFDTMKNYLTN
jgi:inosine-uridine nucleoside N-ribohydrolase